MSIVSSLKVTDSVSSRQAGIRIATALEILVVYGGILQYIWKWQFTHPSWWIPILAVIVLSHVIHRDTIRSVGLGWQDIRSSAQIALPCAALVFIPAAVYGVWSRRLLPLPLNSPALISFLGYAVWSLFQQYLAQSYFNNRLLAAVQDRNLSSVLLGLMFGAAHIPNVPLVMVTGLGGFALAEVFARHRNIWPLALVHAVGGYLVGAVVPDALLHHMRVGPGYFFYLLR